MQTRKLPVSILLSLLATLALLFGGWFLYTKMEVEEPIRAEIGQMKSVNLADVKVDKEQLLITLNVRDPEAFPAEYTELVKGIHEISPDKKINIQLTNQDKSLNQIWTNGVFQFTEAVDLHQYSKIPTLLADWKQTNKLNSASASMDEKNIYVYLERGKAQFFTIVPRTSAPQEVIANG